MKCVVGQHTGTGRWASGGWGRIAIEDYQWRRGDAERTGGKGPGLAKRGIFSQKGEIQQNEEQTMIIRS